MANVRPPNSDGNSVFYKVGADSGRLVATVLANGSNAFPMNRIPVRRSA
jgi:hypothetical protein